MLNGAFLAVREFHFDHLTVPHAPVPVDYTGPGPFEGDGAALIGCSGYLDVSHDTDWFLDAARILRTGGRACSFAILGEGPREVQLRRRLRQAGMCAAATIGVPTTADAGQTLAGLDLYVSCRVPGPGWLDWIRK